MGFSDHQEHREECTEETPEIGSQEPEILEDVSVLAGRLKYFQRNQKRIISDPVILAQI